MHIVILGNGISGITAARNLRKRSRDCRITVVSDEHDFFFSRTALMYVFMGHLRLRDTQPYEDWFWEKNRIALRRARVGSVDFGSKTLLTTAGESIVYDRLILAVGSRPNKFGWPGQDLDGVHGLYHLQDLEAMERHARTGLLRRAVVVGGGLIGIEMAEMLRSRGVEVTFLVREKSFWNSVLPPEESAMVNREILRHGVDLRLGTELAEILPDASGARCRAVRTRAGEEIACQFVGLSVGVSPNVDFLRSTTLEIGRGILVNEFLETSQPDVFAIGDCAEMRRPQADRRAIEAVWYTGRMMGELAAHNALCEGQSLRPYAPGVWFNSAKFFDIEYQIYGSVPAQIPENQSIIFWQHPNGRKSIRLVFERASGKILGFNLMGTRFRHEVCERWITEGAHIETVRRNLHLAHFDAEFSAMKNEI